MPLFTVIAVEPTARDWNAAVGGAMKAYRVTLKDTAGVETSNVEWSRKVASPPPTVGESVEGTLDTSGQYGPKFKKTPGSNFGGGGGGGPRPRDPKESRRIAIQHGQKCAVDILRLAAEHGTYKAPESVGELVTQVKTIAAGLLQQVEEVGA